MRYVLLAIALLLLSGTMARALRTGAPLTFLLAPVWGLLLGLLIGLSKRAFRLRQVKRLLDAEVEFKRLTANAPASPELPIASGASTVKPPTPVSVTENTTLDLKSPSQRWR